MGKLRLREVIREGLPGGGIIQRCLSRARLSRGVALALKDPLLSLGPETALVTPAGGHPLLCLGLRDALLAFAHSGSRFPCLTPTPSLCLECMVFTTPGL